GYGPYFRVYRNTTNNSSTATALGSWQTSPTYNDVSANPLVIYYYWIKAAENASGANSSAFSSSNTGWRNGVTVPINVQASNGTYNNRVYVAWSGTTGNYFRVYRNTTNNSSTATALGSWQTATSYNDYNVVLNQLYYYWVKAASNASGANSSAFSAYDTGWRGNGIVPPTITIEDDNPVESLISTVCPNPVKSNSDFEIAIDFEIEKIKDIKIVDMKGRVQNELHFRDNQTNSSIKLKAPEINGIYLYLIELHNGIRLQNKIIVY
ncbi:MAG: T9SS type A sorting domain-containing protein, partial [Deltaproteobacteria bacterium]